MERADTPTAFHKGDNHALVGGTAAFQIFAAACALRSGMLNIPVIRFVHFYDLAINAESEAAFTQAFADTVTDKPARLFGEPEQAAHLQRAHSLSRRHHHMRGGQPLIQRPLAALVE